MENLFKRNKLDNNNTTNFNWLKKFLFLLWITIFIATMFYYKYSSFKRETIITQDQIISVKSDETFKSIAEKIDSLSSFWFNFYLRFNKPDFELQVGKYELEQGSDISEVIESLKTPIAEKEIYITILEWWNIYDIDACLSDPKKFFEKNNIICAYTLNDKQEKEIVNYQLIESWEYMSYVTNKNKILQISNIEWANFKFLEWLSTLEWFLYPDTYTLSLNNFEIRKLVVDKQLTAFEEKVYNKLLKDIESKSIEELINLASIVEKEEKNSQEKATVAGILKKRLDAWWMIGADITVCYPHELTSEECKFVVSKYINEKSEYNTRTKVWLPKTPISNPSFETIEATLNYKKTPYWFYLHNVSTWKIYYAETNFQHETNKKYMY